MRSRLVPNCQSQNNSNDVDVALPRVSVRDRGPMQCPRRFESMSRIVPILGYQHLKVLCLWGQSRPYTCFNFFWDLAGFPEFV